MFNSFWTRKFRSRSNFGESYVPSSMRLLKLMPKIPIKNTRLWWQIAVDFSFLPTLPLEKQTNKKQTTGSNPSSFHSNPFLSLDMLLRSTWFHPLKQTWNPKNWCFVYRCFSFSIRGFVFRFQPLVFRGCSSTKPPLGNPSVPRGPPGSTWSTAKKTAGPLAAKADCRAVASGVKRR